jgi:phage repressor protein C with HTH and peptisase S24 domain
MVTAQEMGKKGGQAKSEAKAAAARKNASKPRGKWVTAIAYKIANVEKYKAFGCVITKGSPPAGAKNHEWIVAKVRELGVGLQDAGELEFLNLSASSRRF